MMLLLFVISLIALDQLSKLLAVLYLKGSAGLVIVPNFFRLLYIENRGAAFGILQESRMFFIIITIVVLFAILYILRAKRDSVKGMPRLALLLILSGTIGNFIDRIRLSYVIDFLSFRFFNWDFAVFNFADAFIVCGTFLLILSILKEEKIHG